MISKTTKVIKRVAIFGDAMAKPRDKHFRDALKVAELLAKSGYIVVNGGGPGIMLAGTLGAKNGGGRVELVVLDSKKEPGNYEGTDKNNLKLADKVVMTESYEKRLNKLVEMADAFVIFRGGTGTLSEVGLTWEMAKFDYGSHEPLIFFGAFWKKIVNDLKIGLDLEGMERKVVTVVDRAEGVIEVLEKIQTD